MPNKLEKTIIIPVLVVFSAVMIVVVISFFMSLDNAQKDQRVQANDMAKNTSSLVRDRLSIFEETLRAGVGLFSSSGSVTKDGFSNFINTSAVLERYAGAQSVGYIKRVPATQLEAFEAEQRMVNTSNYAVYPVGQRDFYAPVVFIEPQSDSNKKIVGFDTNSDETRMMAQNTARDSGEVTISGVVQSATDSSENGRSFVMYAPQYKQGLPLETVEQRRAAIEGFIYAGFRINNLMDNVLPKDFPSDVSFEITNTDGSLFYKRANFDAIKSSNYGNINSDLVLGNSKLQLHFLYTKQNLLSFSDSRPISILIFGFITALLIAGAIWLILRGKSNELLLEQERGINEAKDNLLSLASHQLRTPATGVKQYLGLLIQGFAGTITDQQKQLLEKAYAGNERQLKTINDVLYLARLGSGRIVLSKSVFEPHVIIEDILRELKDEAAVKKHTIGFTAPKRTRDFYGDEHMIRMAVENLITNAIKYTREGGKITVKIRYGKELKISVIDNGIGIEQSQQDRLFEQFERIDNDLSIAVGGSGIGLYVVRNIAGLHDGHVEVTSELDRGSTFTIVMPYIKAE